MYYTLKRVLCSCLNVTVFRKSESVANRKKGGEGRVEDVSITEFLFITKKWPKVTITQIPVECFAIPFASYSIRLRFSFGS